MKTFYQFFRYGLGSIFTYAFLFGGVYVLAEHLKIPANISYLIILTINYVFSYLISAKFVFSGKFTQNNLAMFGIYVLIFWGFNNLFFNLMYKFTAIHYLLITAINIAIFMPLRFLSLHHIFNRPNHE